MDNLMIAEAAKITAKRDQWIVQRDKVIVETKA